MGVKTAAISGAVAGPVAVTIIGPHPCAACSSNFCLNVA